MELKDKVVVVVGATGGMGVEVCRALHKGGVKLILVARTEEKLKTLSAELGNCSFFVCDLGKPDTIAPVCTQIMANYPIVDVLLNVAGIGVYKPIEEVTETDWMDSFNTNVTASFLFTKYLLPALKQSPKAYVINWGSGMGVIPSAGRSVYCMTKFALRGVSLSLAKEFEGTNVNVVHLTLGSVLTDFGPMTLKEKETENLEGKAYLTPQYVAGKVVEIISSDQADSEVPIFPTGYEEEMKRLS